MAETMFIGAQNLLNDVNEVLKNYQFMVVGGWCPYFISESKVKKHPGTKDVDVLFKKNLDENEWKQLVKKFREQNFIPSAKHPFQLLKEYEVGGEKFIYNVDLMHPHKGGLEKDESMFEEKYDYGVPQNHMSKMTYHLKTIVLLDSSYFFKSSLSERRNVSLQLLDGKRNEIEITFLNEAGIIVSKAESYKNAKRPRDAFDIALSIVNGKDEKGIKNDLMQYVEVINKINSDDILSKSKSYMQNNSINYRFEEKDECKIRNILTRI